MVILGADLHKRWHTVVAVDETGRKLGETTVPATPDGHLELRALGGAVRRSAAGRSRTAGTCRGVWRSTCSGRARRSSACRPSSWPALRRSVREPGKSDPIDALAVAQAALARARTSRSPRSTAPSASCASSSTTATTSSPSAPAHMHRLRWHLLDLGDRGAGGPLARPRRHPGRARGRALAGRSGPAARLARDARSDASAPRRATIRPLEREIEALVTVARPEPSRPARLRPAHRGQDRR